MNLVPENSLTKLATLLAHSPEGSIAIALYDRAWVAKNVIAALRGTLAARVLEVHLDQEQRNPIDIIRSMNPRPRDVVCLFDLQNAAPESLGYLDLQREELSKLNILLVCWVSSAEHRELAQQAPNFYAFRTTVFDFMNAHQREPRPDVPVLFISSTSEDLRSQRDAVRDAALAANFLPRMMEYFAASGERPPLEACLAKVDDADVLVVVVAHRYGWVPPGGEKSITWLECEQAVAAGTEVLAFLVDEKQPWPEELREEYQVTAAIRAGTAKPQLLKEVQRNVKRLRDFKVWLNGRAIRAEFTTAEDLRVKVTLALHDWRTRHAEIAATPSEPHRPPADPTSYLRDLLARTAHIDIRGLQVGTGRAHRFPIEELYIDVTATGAAGEKHAEAGRRKPRSGKEELVMESEHAGDVPLHAALAAKRLVVVGDPGAGKTTFLRRVACALCQTLLDEVPDAAQSRLGLSDCPLPIYIRIADLAEHIAQARHDRSRAKPTTPDAAGWLPHYLDAVSQDGGWGLDEDFFRKSLQSGQCLLLIDGLDEAPDRLTRQSIARLIENAAAAYDRCRMAVTTRPAAYGDETVLAGFAVARIEPLDDAAIGTFLARWCQALYSDSPSDADSHHRELVAALRARPDIRRMARNPVMLTALAVVHWNERRLPEQRADLYDSIITWLARSREQRPERVSADRAVALLQELALAMQCHPDGRQVQVPKRWAAEALAVELEPGAVSRHSLERAERFLNEEELDSGIVVGRGNEVRFWHLTFQEFLAAKAVAGRPDDQLHPLLLGSPHKRLYEPEWREVVLLLAGILHHHGRLKVDRFFQAALDDLGKRSRLTVQARCAGLLGAVIRDLQPLAYQLADARYEKLLDTVLGIFDRRRSEQVPINDRIEAAEALGQAGDPRLDPHHPQRWVPIPASPFLMGNQKTDPDQPNYDPEAYERELPAHEVSLDAFQIARFPVTVAEYQPFVEHGGYAEEKWWPGGGFGRFSAPDDWESQLAYPNRPVVSVSWFEAAAYCRWAGGRLPTEAEWERAARGKEGRKFPWGNEPAQPSRLNFEESNLGRATPVGLYPLGATPDGIADMAGNVLDWCQDWFAEDYYGHSPNSKPAGPERGERRVLRGGSWGDTARNCRAAIRNWGHPDIRSLNVGFRLVCSRQDS